MTIPNDTRARIISLDIATATGWSFRDCDETYSAMPCGARKLEGEIMDKCSQLRSLIRELYREYKPNYFVWEAPLEVAPRYAKKEKRTLFTGSDKSIASVDGLLDRLKVALIRHGPDSSEAKALKIEIFGEEMTMNSKTISQLNRLPGAAQATIEGLPGVAYEQVRSQTWQTIIPKKFVGGTKDRARQFCDSLNIIAKNEDARDACCIAIWCEKRSSHLKQVGLTTDLVQGALL